MVSRTTKQLYYALGRVPMQMNGWLYRQFRQPETPVQVQLGCGRKNYLPGWVNVDANIATAKTDLWANMMDPLPFRPESVSAFYSYHVIEHLPDSFLAQHFAAMYRALMRGGRIRVGGPHGTNAFKKYLEGDARWFSDFPDRRASVGGKLANFILCRGEHLAILTESYLEELAGAAGFRDITFWKPGSGSGYFGREVLSMEPESDPACPHSLVMEAVKGPGGG